MTSPTSQPLPTGRAHTAPTASSPRPIWPAVVGVALVAAAAWAAIEKWGSSASTGIERVPVVPVAIVGRQDLYKELTVQAEFRPFMEVELFSKVAGYMKTISVDFGDEVKAGQVIATIEVPELRNELSRAEAAEARAQAEYKAAHLDFTRLSAVSKTQPNLVAVQDLDTAEAKDGSAEAALAVAKADRERFETLLTYTQIVAPFDGIVTARYADPGAMIQAAASSQTQALPVIRLSQNKRLRLDFPISVSYADQIRVGQEAEIRLDGSGRHLKEPVTRLSQRVAASTRTMEAEVEVPNSDLKLIPGMYATVVLHLDPRPHALSLPVGAVTANANPTVYRVSASGQIEEKPVKLGVEGPDSIEIVDGLSEGDQVVVGSRSGLQPGERVTPKVVSP